VPISREIWHKQDTGQHSHNELKMNLNVLHV